MGTIKVNGRKKKRPTLGAAIIVKNEEEKLPRMLESIGHLDQIVIIDTGSTDNTFSIIEEFKDAGVKIHDHHFFQEPFNFSDARNESFRHITTDLILIIDADEWIPNPDPVSDKDPWPLIWKALTEMGDTVDGFYINHHNLLPDNQVLSDDSSEALRIIPNRYPTVHWSGRVHNQILHTILENPRDGKRERFAKIEISMMHDGYKLSPEEKKRKFKVRLPLLRDEIKYREEKGEMERAEYYRFQLANMHYMLEDYESCVKVGKEIDMNLLQTHNQWNVLVTGTAAAMKILDPIGDEWTDKFLELGISSKDNPQPIAFMQKGLWYFRNQEYLKAYPFLLTAFHLNTDGRINSLHNLDQLYLSGLVGECLTWLGQPLEAKTYLDIAVSKYGDNKTWVAMHRELLDIIRGVSAEFGEEGGAGIKYTHLNKEEGNGESNNQDKEVRTGDDVEEEGTRTT